MFGTKDKQTGAPARAVLTTSDINISSVAKTLPSDTRKLADHTKFTNERLPFYKMSNSQSMEVAINKTTSAPLLATPAVLKRKLSKVEDTPLLRTPLLSRLNESMINMSPPSESRSSPHPTRTKRARLSLTPAREKDNPLENTNMEITCPDISAFLHISIVPGSVKQQTRDVKTPQSV